MAQWLIAHWENKGMKYAVYAKFFAALLIGWILWAMAGCTHQKVAAMHELPQYDFTYTGNMYYDDTIQFQCTAPDTAALLWNFGDGTLSTAHAPSHVFQTGDSFLVTLTVDSTGKVSKYLKILSPANMYIDRVTLGRTWKGFGLLHYPWVDTTFYSDTSFSLRSLTNNSFTLFGQAMTYYQFKTSDSSVEYRNDPDPPVFASLVYYISRDSMSLTYTSNSGMSSWQAYYHTE